MGVKIKKGRRTSLKKIAALMHQDAMSRGHATIALSGGLRIKLHYRDDDIVLVLWRRDVPPSTCELEACIQNFFINAVPYKIVNSGRYWYVGVKRDAFFGKDRFPAFPFDKEVI